MRKLLSFIILFNIVVAQQHDESELKCSHANIANAMITKHLSPIASQSDYDVTFYDIDLKIDPVEEKIYGEVGVLGISLIQSLAVIDLDLSYVLSVVSVKNEHGNNLGYEHISSLLKVTLNTPINTGETFNIIIEYNGKPQASGFGSFGFSEFPPTSGIPMIWSLSEPYGARDWWPCKDTPTDKADSVNISLEVPSNLIAASNGLLVNTELNGRWKTYHWQERYPIATYLVSIAIHPYTVFFDNYISSNNDTMRLEYYVFPDHYDYVQYTYGLTKDMIGAMASRYGEYPFINEKYGHAEFVWGGGMEHQTLTSLGGYSEGLIAHELGHQWWGDMVTCASFHHIWLNEGFATYSEALWYEIRDNDIQSLHNEMDANKAWYGWRDGSIYIEDTTSVSSIFNGSLSYAKASWVVHMLRHVVGDENFFNGLQEYGKQYRFSSATTEQFQTVIEEVSEMDLDYFFQRWIYGELYPIYEVVYDQNGDSLLVEISQIQDSDVFEMPIDIKVNFTDGSTFNTVIHNSERVELFLISIGEQKIVKSLEFDPEDWILKKVSEIKLDTLNINGIPEEFYLYHVFPNPFNANTTLKFRLVQESTVIMNIYDILGNKVWQLIDEYKAGIHSIKWDGIDNQGLRVPSGSYLLELDNGKEIKTRKMLLLK